MARRPTAQQKQIDALLRAYTPRVRDAFLAAIQSARDNLDMGALIAALDARDIERAVALFRMDQALLFPLDDAIRGTYVAAGVGVASALPRLPAGVFGFNGRHQRAEEYLRRIGAEMVTNISQAAMEAAREVISTSFEANVGTREIARNLGGRVIAGKRQGGVIGLTRPQAMSINSGMAKLASGDPELMREYLTLKQRDRRYDGLIKKAIKAEKAPAKADLDRIRAAHESKAQGIRAQIVSENETFTAQAAGRDEAYRQIAERDDIEAVTVRWQHNLSENPREDHKAMDGTVIKLGEDFVFEDALMAHPHDPRGGAKHSIKCRCVAIYRPVVAMR